MRRSIADRTKAILQELDLPIGSEAQNIETLHKFLADHGYKGFKNINNMKHFYEEFKTIYKKEVLKYFNVEFTNGDDLDSKLNQLLRDQHSEVLDPTLGWLMKWFERTTAEQQPTNPPTEADFPEDLMNMETPNIRLQ